MSSNQAFEELVGHVVDFYGVDNNRLCIGIDGKRYAYEVIEDECDGYRSMMKELVSVPLKGNIFFRQPIAKVLVMEDTDYDGYKLVDAANEHVWLRMGTDNYDDYYPCFKFDYEPDGSEV